jgi:hypothetical protein
MTEESVEIECNDADDAFVERLIGIVANMAGKFVDLNSGVAGCVELKMMTFTFGESTVSFNFDNYGSAELRGPRDIVQEIHRRLQPQPKE